MSQSLVDTLQTCFFIAVKVNCDCGPFSSCKGKPLFPSFGIRIATIQNDQGLVRITLTKSEFASTTRADIILADYDGRSGSPFGNRPCHPALS